MLNRFRIGARLGGAFAVVLLLLAAVAATGMFGVFTVSDTTHTALRTDGALAANAGRVRLLALEGRRYEKDVLINMDQPERSGEYFQKWASSMDALDATLRDGLLLARAPEMKRLYQDALTGLAAYREDFSGIHARLVAGEFGTTGAANRAFSESKQGIYQLEASAEAIATRAMAELDKLGDTLTSVVTSTVTGVLLFTAVALIIAVILAVVITRGITRPLGRALSVARRVAEGDLRQAIVAEGRDEPAQLLRAMADMQDALTGLVSSLRGASENVYIGANEIAAGAEDLSSRTEQQATALQETAASMEEITATASNNEQSTRRADELASGASRSARASGEEVRESIRLMQEIASRSARMNSIIETIDGISFQTNILALNASVEAARAGEKGRGFAVVASEVRNLAARAASSSGEIRTLLEDTRTQIESCATQATRSGVTLESAVKGIEELAGLMKEVASATGEQIGGIQQISVAVTEIDTATQQNAALVQESSSAAASLEDQAARLKSLVASFRIAEEA
ncbi:methyl-accepting chemotaxis protein [Alloalcanivorax marinus]|nr:methyl-accepting chemotaxis protein [Alloalcanivorax marinus]MCU5787764.1 methyl accepting chemotaxis sensory transducer [Alloalcanivorax marinus]